MSVAEVSRFTSLATRPVAWLNRHPIVKGAVKASAAVATSAAIFGVANSVADFNPGLASLALGFSTVYGRITTRILVATAFAAMLIGTIGIPIFLPLLAISSAIKAKVQNAQTVTPGAKSINAVV